jgi:hypothetical protein
MSSRRSSFLPIDVQMMVDTEAARREDDSQLAMFAMNYAGMGLLVTSSRKCNDGALASGVVYMPGKTQHDLRAIRDEFEGFEEPAWPEKHHGWIH